jgi:hypothetical protein
VLSVSKVVVENLRSAVYASYEELSAQVQADSALDTKLLGLLGFLAAAGSLLLTVSHLRDGRTLLLVGVGLGAVACLVGSMGGPSPGTGPSPEMFYANYGGRDEADYLAQLLADLAIRTRINHQGLELRRKALAVAIGIPVAVAFVYGLVRVL